MVASSKPFRADDFGLFVCYLLMVCVFFYSCCFFLLHFGCSFASLMRRFGFVLALLKVCVPCVLPHAVMICIIKAFSGFSVLSFLCTLEFWHFLKSCFAY